MTLHLLDHVVFVLLALVFPIVGFFSIRKLVASLRAGRTELRIQMYRKVIWEEWVGVLALSAMWFGLGRSASALGLIPTTGGWVWAGYALTIVICGLLALQMRSAAASKKSLAAFRDQLGEADILVPHTLAERRTFDFVSLTAGICEELIYRGFLIAYLTSLLGVSLWVAALLSSVVFGLSHMYQGPLGALKTGVLGLTFAILFVLTGSLWAPMIVHAVVDLLAGRTSYKAFSETPENSSPALAA